MLHRRRALNLLALVAWGISSSGTAVATAPADTPALLLASVYRPGMDLQD